MFCLFEVPCFQTEVDHVAEGKEVSVAKERTDSDITKDQYSVVAAIQRIFVFCFHTACDNIYHNISH